MHIRILGAGVLGLSAAISLAQRGHEVEVLDPQGVGAGASGKAAGIVSTMTLNDDDFHLVQDTRGRLGQLIAEAGFDVPAAEHCWHSHDSIAIAAGDQIATLDEVQHRLERLGEEPERFDHLQAASAFPMLAFQPGEEVLVAQEDGAVEAGDLCTVLAWAAQEEGAVLQSGPRATASASQRLGSAVDTADGAEATVVAAGAWTPGILQSMGVTLPLASFRTQAASIALPDAEVPIVHDVVQGFYFRPESQGSIMAGDGTRLTPHHPDDYDESADTEFRDSVAMRLTRRLRDAEAAAWRNGWAGLCVGTPDQRPVCGAVPGLDDVWVLSGDNGHGVMRCLALGERLAHAIDGDEAPATSPSRFGEVSDWRLQEGFAW